MQWWRWGRMPPRSRATRLPPTEGPSGSSQRCLEKKRLLKLWTFYDNTQMAYGRGHMCVYGTDEAINTGLSQGAEACWRCVLLHLSVLWFCLVLAQRLTAGKEINRDKPVQKSLHRLSHTSLWNWLSAFSTSKPPPRLGWFVPLLISTWSSSNTKCAGNKMEEIASESDSNFWTHLNPQVICLCNVLCGGNWPCEERQP